jgi:hypothetical protein
MEAVMTDHTDANSYEDSKELALQSIASMERYLEEAAVLIASTKYSIPDLVPPGRVRNLLKSAAIALEITRRSFERSRWTVARTELDFEPWLADQGWSERRLTQSETGTIRRDNMDSPTAGARDKNDPGAILQHRNTRPPERCCSS